MTPPAPDLEFNQFSVSENKKAYEVFLLQFLQRSQCLAVEAGAEMLRKLIYRHDPFTGIDGIADAVDALIRGAEVGIGAEDDIIIKTGASAHANAPVCYQGLHELSVDSASWIIYDLFDLKCIF